LPSFSSCSASAAVSIFAFAPLTSILFIMLQKKRASVTLAAESSNGLCQIRTWHRSVHQQRLAVEFVVSHEFMKLRSALFEPFHVGSCRRDQLHLLQTSRPRLGSTPSTM
jgi:hypothetical protein